MKKEASNNFSDDNNEIYSSPTEKKVEVQNNGIEREYEDFISHSKPKGFFQKIKYFFRYKVKPFFLRNNKQNLKRTFLILGVILLALIIAGVIVAYNFWGGLIDDNGGDLGATVDRDEDFLGQVHDLEDAESLNELLMQWSTNGDRMSSSNVINVLLLGIDSTDGQMKNGRSDAIMLVSLNKKTKKITLISLLRDSYTYMKIGNSVRYDKTNHSYIWGGPAATVEVIESNYKIVIDHYVSVDFVTFPKLIDIVGGVTVPITQAESNYMRNRWKTKVPAGDEVLLNGNQALLFSRIRKLDSDEERGRRQRTVISALIKKSTDATTGQLTDLVVTALPKIKTNMTQKNILSLGTSAITQGWMNYDMVSSSAPREEHRRGVKMDTYSYRGLDVWIVDYALAAREVQMTIYGKSNIQISDNHISPFDYIGKTAKPASTTRNNSSGIVTTSRPSYQGSTVPNRNPTEEPTVPPETLPPIPPETEQPTVPPETENQSPSRGSLRDILR